MRNRVKILSTIEGLRKFVMVYTTWRMQMGFFLLPRLLYCCCCCSCVIFPLTLSYTALTIADILRSKTIA